MFKELTLFFNSSSVQNIYSNEYIHMNNTFTIFICKAHATVRTTQRPNQCDSHMEMIFKVYSAEIQNVLFYSALAMEFEVTNKKEVSERQSCLNYSRSKTI